MRAQRSFSVLGFFACGAFFAACGSSGVSGDAGGAGGGAGVGGTGAQGTVSSVATGGAAVSVGSGGEVVGPRALPDTTGRIALLVDRLPAALSPAQVEFSARHYVGARKLLLPLAKALRAVEPSFVVLHDRLGIWQGGEELEFIVDGASWGSDYPIVTTHEPWFWHEPGGARVASALDGKWLMNVGSSDFAAYWYESVGKQAALGDADGIVATSAGPVSSVAEGFKPIDPRLQGTGVVETKVAELGNRTYAEVWEKWATTVGTELASKKLPVFFEVGGLTEAWDDTNYGAASGLVVDVGPSASIGPSEWLGWMNRLLPYAKSRPLLLRGRLDSPANLALRKYVLGVYLLLRGPNTYLGVRHATSLEWYPEWRLDLGAPLVSASSIDAYAGKGGAFVRAFEKGEVYVNAFDGPLLVKLEQPRRRVVFRDGGAVFADGAEPGSLDYVPTDTFEIGPHSAEFVLPLEDAPAP